MPNKNSEKKDREEIEVCEGTDEKRIWKSEAPQCYIPHFELV